MANEWTNVLVLGVTWTLQLLQQVCMVVVAVLIALRMGWLRAAVYGARRSAWHTLITVCLFTVLAVIGTHSGIVVNIDRGAMGAWPAALPTRLADTEAVINFRDLFVIAAGLIGGPLCGSIVGVLAGLERYGLGGLSAAACAMSTVLTGVGAGLLAHLRPQLVNRPTTAILVGSVSVIVQMGLIWQFALPHEGALKLINQTALPMLLTNSVGAGLFIWTMQFLDKYRLELVARQAEIRSLQAQVEPHFLMNTLNAVKQLIRSDPEQARAYVVKLGHFFRATWEHSAANSVSLEQELKHQALYCDFQRLRFGEAMLHCRHEIDPKLRNCQLPPLFATNSGRECVHPRFPQRPSVTGDRHLRRGATRQSGISGDRQWTWHCAGETGTARPSACCVERRLGHGALSTPTKPATGVWTQGAAID